MCIIFIAELALATTSSAPVDDLYSELTQSVTKLSVARPSRTRYGSTGDGVSKVRKFLRKLL